MDAPDESSGGSKRKYKENALTAKAESGTLRVKILRKDQQQLLRLQQQAEALLDAAGPPTAGAKAAGRRTAAPASPDSPPKPRPNRKHVPIFYQQSRRARADHSAALDLQAAQFSSSSSASSASGPASDFGVSASTSSTGTAYASLLSGLQLDSASSTGASASIADLLPPPPAANPLFSRSDSDGIGSLSELLRPHFPSASGPSFSLSGGLLPPHMLLSGSSATSVPPGASSAISMSSMAPSSSSPDAGGSTAALHQLASSSQQYRSALDALTAATVQSGSLASAASSLPPPSSPASREGDKHPAGSSDAPASEYKFNPFSALQSAIDHAQQLSQTLASQQHGEKTAARPPGEHNGSGSSSTDNGIQRLLDDGSDDDAGSSTSLGPPPPVPPPFSLQNSLMGGGIEALTSKSSSPNVSSKGKAAASASRPLATPPRELTAPLESPSGADGDLGPPPPAPPAFRIENSLMGGGIETMPTIANVNTHNFDWKFHKVTGKLIKPSPPRGAGGGGKAAERDASSSSGRRDDGKDSREAVL